MANPEVVTSKAIRAANLSRLNSFTFDVWKDHIIRWLDLSDVIALGGVSLQLQRYILDVNEYSHRLWAERSKVEFPFDTAVTALDFQRLHAKYYAGLSGFHRNLFYRFALGDLPTIRSTLLTASNVDPSLASDIIACYTKPRTDALCGNRTHSPIDLASYNGHLPLIEWSLQRVKQLSPFQLHLAMWGRQVKTVQYLIKHFPSLLEYAPLMGRSTLALAVQAKFEEGVKVLLQNKQKTFPENTTVNHDILSIACGPCLNLTILKLLIDAGARVGSGNESALYALLSSPGEDVIALQLLIKAGANVNEFYYTGQRGSHNYIVNHLYIALLHQHAKYAAELRAAGADIGRTLLMAIRLRNAAIISSLAPWVDLNTVHPFRLDIFGGPDFFSHPLLYAIENSTVDIYKQLVTAGADDSTLNVINFVIQHCKVEFLQFFLERDPTCIAIDEKKDLSCLHQVLAQQGPQLRMRNLAAIIEILIKANLPLNTRVNKSRHAHLHDRCKNGDTLMDSLMLCNSDMGDPIHVGKLLIRRGVKFNCTQNWDSYNSAIPDLATYFDHYQHFVSAFNACNTKSMNALRDTCSVDTFNDFSRDALNGMIPDYRNAACQQRWLRNDILQTPETVNHQPPSLGMLALSRYQTSLFTSVSRSKKQKATAIEAADPIDKLQHAVQPRRTSTLFITRRSILTLGGQKLVREHPEFQTIRMACEWTEQYLKLLKRKLQSSKKYEAIRTALDLAKQNCENPHTTNADAFDAFMNAGLAQAIQIQRHDKGLPKGWQQFLSIFTDYANRQAPNQGNDIHMIPVVPE